ncbi:NAD(P)H-binding [Mucilaginibacter mallensis]|uniref:NAD(P)H-binding n=2 Tax=Mucilaginibacter mallensis TaxID=652787 RepID=A0A1H2C3V3_MUCMA|nr:NAD(P)H-binding [Mucilaginibacter mallensis]
MYFCKEICLNMAYKAIIAGASGLIGSKLLTILLNQPEYAEVVILVRKSTGIQHAKLKELVIDYDQLDNYADEISGHAIFSCLGTTNNKTSDKNVYRKIDHDYPVKLAQLALKNGVKQFHLVSSIGANAQSSTFYIKLKGETEEDIIKVGLKTVHIYQPSLITGDRKEHRLAEKIITPIMKLIDPLLFGSLKKYRSIPAQTIAMAMFKESINNEEGIFIHPSDNIKQIA